MDSINSPHPSFVKTPFEAQFLCQLSGPQPGSLCVDRGEEGHYVFTLHVDFFNPEGLNIRGASTSCGIISMACLNLPLDIKYKPENMYLAGIIPGLKQPSLENLNHYIHLLINDLVDAWQRGIKFSNTACYPHGWLTRSALPWLFVTFLLLIILLLWLGSAVTSTAVHAIVITSLPVEELTLRNGNLRTEKNCENMLSSGETPLHPLNVKDCLRLMACTIPNSGIYYTGTLPGNLSLIQCTASWKAWSNITPEIFSV
jgi:hypothetical protein